MYLKRTKSSLLGDAPILKARIAASAARRMARVEAGRRGPRAVAKCLYCGARLTPSTRKNAKPFCSRLHSIWYRNREDGRKRTPEERHVAYERSKEYHVTYRKRNREKMRLYARVYRKENRERLRQEQRENPLLGAMKAALHRSRRKRGTFTVEEWTALVVQYKGRCSYCEETRKLTIDHKLPLSRGGTNTIDNIIPACLPCNSSKRDKTEEEYRQWLQFVRA